MKTTYKRKKLLYQKKHFLVNKIASIKRVLKIPSLIFNSQLSEYENEKLSVLHSFHNLRPNDIP